MINWKELEKFIIPGKVCTLVIMIDGKEIGAFSFNIETLAYKESLEQTVKTTPVIAEKVVEKKPEPAKTEVKKPEPKKAPVDKNDKTKRHPEFNPIPATAEVKDPETENDWDNGGNYDNDDDDRNFDVDENTGEIKETVLTAEQIVEAEEQSKQQGPAKEPEQIKVPKKTIEPVAAARIDEEPEPKTQNKDVKNENIQAPVETGGQEANFTEELW